MVDARTRTGTHALTLPLNEKLDEHCEQKKEKRLDGEKKRKEKTKDEKMPKWFLSSRQNDTNTNSNTHTRAHAMLFIL